MQLSIGSSLKMALIIVFKICYTLTEMYQSNKEEHKTLSQVTA